MQNYQPPESLANSATSFKYYFYIHSEVKADDLELTKGTADTSTRTQVLLQKHIYQIPLGNYLIYFP